MTTAKACCLALTIGLLVLAPAGASPARADVVGTDVDAPGVFDPKLAGASCVIESQLATGSSYPARVSVYDPSGRLLTTLVSGATRSAGRVYRDVWDGRDTRGRFVAPGAYTVLFDAGNGVRRTTTVNVVRLGILAMAFRDGPDGATRVPLAWHRASATTSGSTFAVDAAGPPYVLAQSALAWNCLDATDGSPLALPARWTNTASPPRAQDGTVPVRDRSLPIAYVGAGRPRVIVLLGETAATDGQLTGCGYPIAGVPIRMVLDRRIASAEVAPGQTTLLELAPLAAGVRRETRELRFEFQYDDGSGWEYAPGEIRTQHDLYVTAGRPDTSDGTAWVGAVDLVAGWTRGNASSPGAVLDEVVRGVNGRLGLTYEDRGGAPAYTYSPSSLAYPDMYLSAMLDGRRLGNRVNCLDCAGTVSSLARHVGVPSQVVVIGWNFDLHWLRGIGGSSFRHDLFGGFHSFSYHAWASRDRGSSVHDACLSVDGDSRPDRSPFTEALPAGMGLSAYLRQLSPDTHVRVQDVGKAGIR